MVCDDVTAVHEGTNMLVQNTEHSKEQTWRSNDIGQGSKLSFLYQTVSADSHGDSHVGSNIQTVTLQRGR
jgi:hypothetical protein